MRDSQIERLKKVRAGRDSAAVEHALHALTECARSGEGNLLDLTVQAVRARATVGEVSDALEKVWGRFRATNQVISGVYGAAFGMDQEWQDLKAEVEAFAAAEGRRPRVMIAKLGQDGHDRGAKVVATALADLGFDIDIGPLFQTPEEAARQAIENDCHAIGVSTLAAGHKTLVPALVQALKDQGAEDIVVFVGGVIPAQDYDFLRAGRRRRHLRPGHADPDLCQAGAQGDQGRRGSTRDGRGVAMPSRQRREKVAVRPDGGAITSQLPLLRGSVYVGHLSPPSSAR